MFWKQIEAPYAAATDQADAMLRVAGYVILALIVLLSLWPFDWAGGAAARIPLLFAWRDQIPSDVIQNIAAFCPIGIVFGAPHDARARHRDLVWAVGVAMLLQLAQLWLPVRMPRLSDALLNGVGLMAGYGIARSLHGMRAVAGAPQPIEVAIMMFLLSHVLLAAGARFGWGMPPELWQMNMHFWGVTAVHQLALYAVAGAAARALVNDRPVASWVMVGVLAALMLCAGPSLVPAAGCLLAGAAALHLLPQPVRGPAALLALIGMLLWDGLTPWIVYERTMNWMPFRSLLIAPSLPLFFTLSWKLYCWSAMALLLFRIVLMGRAVVAIVTISVGLIEWAQTQLASGIPDITDILLAAGVSTLVVLSLRHARLHAPPTAAPVLT